MARDERLAHEHARQAYAVAGGAVIGAELAAAAAGVELGGIVVVVRLACGCELIGDRPGTPGPETAKLLAGALREVCRIHRLPVMVSTRGGQG